MSPNTRVFAYVHDNDRNVGRMLIADTRLISNSLFSDQRSRLREKFHIATRFASKIR